MNLFRATAIQWIDRGWPSAMAVGACGLLTVLYLWEPAASGFFPPCPFHALTGLHCPGCGSLRATHQLLHGNLWAALRLNPLMVLATPVVAYAIAASVWPRLQTQWANRIAAHPAWPLAILIAVVAYWVLRNLPFEPFVWLAPQAPFE
jgi:hypothetical protein